MWVWRVFIELNCRLAIFGAYSAKCALNSSPSSLVIFSTESAQLESQLSCVMYTWTHLGLDTTRLTADSPFLAHIQHRVRSSRVPALLCGGHLDTSRSRHNTNTSSCCNGRAPMAPCGMMPPAQLWPNVVIVFGSGCAPRPSPPRGTRAPVRLWQVAVCVGLTPLAALWTRSLPYVRVNP